MHLHVSPIMLKKNFPKPHPFLLINFLELTEMIKTLMHGQLTHNGLLELVLFHQLIIMEEMRVK